MVWHFYELKRKWCVDGSVCSLKDRVGEKDNAEGRDSGVVTTELMKFGHGSERKQKWKYNLVMCMSSKEKELVNRLGAGGSGTVNCSALREIKSLSTPASPSPLKYYNSKFHSPSLTVFKNSTVRGLFSTGKQPQQRSGFRIWDVWKVKWEREHRILMQADRLSAAGKVLLLLLLLLLLLPWASNLSLLL